MSFSSPFASGPFALGPAGDVVLPGQRRDDGVDVVLLTGSPRVDLLPLAVARAERFRRVQLGLAGAAALVLLGCAGATLLAGTEVTRAQDALAVEQARTAELQAQQARYAEVPLLRSQAETLTAARDTAMADDVLWHRYTAHLSNVLPADLHLTSLSMQLVDAAADPAQPVDVDAAIGSMTLSLEGRVVPDSADLLDVLSSTSGLSGAWADSTTAAAEGGGTTVQAHADLSPDARSGRYGAQGTAAAPAEGTAAATTTGS